MCLHILVKIPATYTCENGLYVQSNIDNSEIICDEIIGATKCTSRKTIPIISTSTKLVPTKRTSTYFYILLIFLSITIALLIAVSIYWYLIKNQSKQKYLLTYHDTSNKSIEINNNIII